jgi:uncharacterized coiled-coil protein SlyX
MGWYPQEEFHGRPDDWIDAEKFIERAEREHPILRENLKRLDHRAARAELTAKQLNDQLTSVNAKVEEMSEALDAMRELNSKAEQRGRERALAAIKRNAAQAAADGDAVAVGEALEQVEKLLETGQKAGPAKPKEQAQRSVAANRPNNAAAQQQPDPVAVAWASSPEREWYRSSAPMFEYANAIFTDLSDRKPNMPMAEKLNEVEYEVQQRWSNSGFFAGRNITRNTSPVDSGGEVNKPRGGGSKADKTFDALPAEVKREYERVAKSYEARKGKPGYKPYQKAEFLRLYHGDTED